MAACVKRERPRRRSSLRLCHIKTMKPVEVCCAFCSDILRFLTICHEIPKSDALPNDFLGLALSGSLMSCQMNMTDYFKAIRLSQLDDITVVACVVQVYFYIGTHFGLFNVS